MKFMMMEANMMSDHNIPWKLKKMYGLQKSLNSFYSEGKNVSCPGAGV